MRLGKTGKRRVKRGIILAERGNLKKNGTLLSWV